MAISLVNSISGNATADNTPVAGTAHISLSGLIIQQDDFLVIAVFTRVPSDINMSGTGNNSGACTEVADLYANDTQDSNLWVGIAKQGATADTTIDVIMSAASGTTCGYFVYQYRGVDTTTPQDVAATTATGINTDRANAPSITPTTAGAVIVVAMAAAQNTGTAFTTPSDLSNVTQVSGSPTLYRGVIGDKAWTSGAFDPAVLAGGDNAASNSWTACTLALRPTAGGGGGNTGNFFLLF